MNLNQKEKLIKIAEFDENDIGESEENVKQKIFVPILECLGHQRNQLDFEHTVGGKRIDILINDGLPRDSKIIIDTKKYNEDLDKHVDQIKEYAFQKGALLAILANGKEIRIYSPDMRGYKFKESLIYLINRTDLKKESTFEMLNNLLSRENLINRETRKYIVEKEEEIRLAFNKTDKFVEEFKYKRENLNDQKIDFQQELEKIQEKINETTKKINELESEERKAINEIWNFVGLPSPFSQLRKITVDEPGGKVTAGDFDHLRNGIFYYKTNRSIEIDAKKSLIGLNSSNKLSIE